MTILSLGAATNIALLLLKYPELENRIEEIVAVAGRRSLDQHFISGKWQPEPFRDLNFETDPRAFRILLQRSVPLTLVPYEACSSVWIKPRDLFSLSEANRIGKFLACRSIGWISEWETIFGANGFNPFDLVAAGYLIAPNLFSSQQLHAKIATGPDDTAPGKTKPYLLCNTTAAGTTPVTYCTGTDSTCKDFLLERIRTHDMASFILGLSHINVIVDSIEEATQFYSETLGFIQAWDENGDIMDYLGIEMEAFALDAGIMDGQAKVDVRFLKHPQAGIFLELMHYHTPRGKNQIPPQPRTFDAGGPRHIAMEVSNCNEVFRFLKDREGVTMINSGKSYHPVKLNGFPITFFYWIDKYGIQWEMEEGRRMGNSSRSII
jgi:catechol 2,3-dioxygenase-like lactoylglutathione lyase family enzyme